MPWVAPVQEGAASPVFTCEDAGWATLTGPLAFAPRCVCMWASAPLDGGVGSHAVGVNVTGGRPCGSLGASCFPNVVTVQVNATGAPVAAGAWPVSNALQDAGGGVLVRGPGTVQGRVWDDGGLSRYQGVAGVVAFDVVGPRWVEGHVDVSVQDVGADGGVVLPLRVDFGAGPCPGGAGAVPAPGRR